MNITQKDCRYKTAGAGINMTLTALGLRRDMIELLALGDNAVVAGRANIGYNGIQMIKASPGEIIKLDHVTIRAIPDGNHVIAALSGTNRTVVAGCAVAGNTRMVKNRPHKGVCREMTDSAILASGHMINMLACGDHTVVTRRTSHEIDDTRIMVKHTRFKSTWCMTSTTI